MPKFPGLTGSTACLACPVWLATLPPESAPTSGRSSPAQKIELSTGRLPP
jgi:hypothetical protein